MTDEMEFRVKGIVETDASQTRREIALVEADLDKLQRKVESYTQSSATRTPAAQSSAESRYRSEAVALQTRINQLEAAAKTQGSTAPPSPLAGTGAIDRVTAALPVDRQEQFAATTRKKLINDINQQHERTLSAASSSANDEAAASRATAERAQAEKVRAAESKKRAEAEVTAPKTSVISVTPAQAKSYAERGVAETIPAGEPNPFAQIADRNFKNGSHFFTFTDAEASALVQDAQTQIAAGVQKNLFNSVIKRTSPAITPLLETPPPPVVLQPTPPGGFDKPVVPPATTGKQEGLGFGETSFALQNPTEGSEAKTAAEARKQRQAKILAALDEDAIQVAEITAADTATAAEAKKTTAIYRGQKFPGAYGPSFTTDLERAQKFGPYVQQIDVPNEQLPALKAASEQARLQGLHQPAANDLFISDTLNPEFTNLLNSARPLAENLKAAGVASSETATNEKVIAEESAQTAVAAKKRTKAVQESFLAPPTRADQAVPVSQGEKIQLPQGPILGPPAPVTPPEIAAPLTAEEKNLKNVILQARALARQQAKDYFTEQLQALQEGDIIPLPTKEPLRFNPNKLKRTPSGDGGYDSIPYASEQLINDRRFFSPNDRAPDEILDRVQSKGAQSSEGTAVRSNYSSVPAFPDMRELIAHLDDLKALEKAAGLATTGTGRSARDVINRGFDPAFGSSSIDESVRTSLHGHDPQTVQTILDKGIYAENPGGTLSPADAARSVAKSLAEAEESARGIDRSLRGADGNVQVPHAQVPTGEPPVVVNDVPSSGLDRARINSAQIASQRNLAAFEEEQRAFAASGGAGSRTPPPPPPPTPPGGTGGGEPPDDEAARAARIRELRALQAQAVAAGDSAEAQRLQAELDREIALEKRALAKQVRDDARPTGGIPNRPTIIPFGNDLKPPPPDENAGTPKEQAAALVGATRAEIEKQTILNEQGYSKGLAQLRLLLQESSAAIEKTLLSEGDIFKNGQAYAKALADTRAAQAQTNANVNKLLVGTDGYAKSLAENKLAQEQVKAQTERLLAADSQYIEATAAASNARKVLAERTKTAELQGVGFENLTPHGILLPPTEDTGVIEARRASGRGLLAQMQASNTAQAQFNKVQTDLAQAVARQKLNAEAAANGGKTEADLIVQRRTIEAQLAQSLEIQLANDKVYLDASVALSAAKRKRAANEEAGLQTELAGNQEYISATAQAANARRLQAARIKEQELAGTGLAGVTGSGIIVPTDHLDPQQLDAANRAGLVAVQKLEAANSRKAELVSAQLKVEEEKLGFSKAEAQTLAEGAAAEKRISQIIKQRVAAEEQALYDAKVAAGAGADQIGTGFQRLQASIATRGDNGNFKDPLQFAQIGQFLKSRFLTTAGFAVSGVATYAAFSGIQKMITDSAVLEKTLQQIHSEFDALGDGKNFASFRNGILSISRSTGEAANDVAKLALQFKGAFGQKLDDSQILAQVQSAVQLSRVTGITLDEITNNLTATAVTYGTTVQHVGDVVLTLQDRTGVAAKESIQALSDMAVAAQESGLTLEQTAAIATVAAKYTGQSGASVAEGLNRILPAIESKAGQIIELFNQADPAKAGDITKALAQGNTGDVFRSLGAEYNNLTKAQKEYLVSLLGSRRDAKTAIDVFQRYGEVVNNVGAALDSNGRLEKSYAALQDTLSQQLARLLAAFKNIGQAILSLGVSDAIQDIAKSLGVVVVAISDVVSFFAKLNETFADIPGKALAIVATFVALYKIMKTVEELKIGGAIVKGLSAIPGTAILQRVTQSAAGAKKAAAANEAEATATAATTALPGGLIITNAGKEAAADVTQGKTSVVRELRTFGATMKTQAQEAGTTISKVGVGIGAALEGLGTALETFAPLIAIAAVTATINAVSNSRKKAQSGEQNYADRLSQLSYDELINSPKNSVSSGSNIGLGPLRLPSSIVGGIEGTKTPDQVRQDEIQKRQSQAQAQAIRTLSTQDRASIAKAAGLNADEFEKNLKDLAKNGTTSDSTFGAFQKAVDFAKSQHKNLNSLINNVLRDSSNQKKDAEKLTKELTDLPTLQVEENLGQISPLEFAQKAKAVRDDLTKALNIAIKNHAPADTVNSLKQQLDATNTALDGIFSKSLTDLVAARNAASGIRGQSQQQSLLASVAANVAALNEPGALDSSAAPTLANNVVTAQQSLLKFLVDHASSVAEGRRIAEKGLKLPQAAVQALESTALATGLPPNVENELVGAARSLGKTTQQIIDKIVQAKGGLKRGIEAIIKELNDAAAKLLKEGGAGNLAQAQRDIERARILGNSLSSGAFDSSTFDTTRNPPPEAPTTDEQISAQNAINLARAGQDPLKQAQERQREANQKVKDALKNHTATRVVDIQNARAEQAQANQAVIDANNEIQNSYIGLLQAQAGGDPLKEAQVAIVAAQQQIAQAKGKGTAAANAAKAALIAAQLQYTQAVQSIQQAQLGVLTALADGDPVKTAEIAVQLATLQYQQAIGQAAKLQALAAEIGAQHQLRDAINASSDASANVAIAIATAQGDVVGAAQKGLDLAKKVLSRDLAQGQNYKAPDDLKAVIEAQANLRDVTLQHSEDNIQFLLNTQKISTGQAIARLRTLDQNQRLTEAEHHQIEEQIFNLQHQLQQDLQFNLPSDIKLPTFYEATRFDQSGGTQNNSHYQDNRRITVNITTNAKADPKDVLTIISDNVNAPSRYGTRPGTY